MISLYRPGNSWLHRTPVALKFAALVLGLLAISIFAKDVTSVVSILLFAILSFTLIGTNAKQIFAMLWSLKLVVLLVLLPQLLFMDWSLALVNVTRLVACILFAMLFTSTTKNQEILELVELLAKPLKGLGIRPNTIALLVAMALNSIALLNKFVADIREAQLARGMKPKLHRLVLPVLVLSLKHADDHAEALLARGVEV
ncbi:MAG: hypothetical protein RLZZ258_157 [Actinomycetota bacterium]